MSKIDKLKKMFNCKVCSDLLQDPVLLPCSKTVCKKHAEEISLKECIFCSKIHQIPEDGFLVNELIEEQLKMELNKINVNFFHSTDCQVLLDDLTKKLNEVELIRRQGEFHR